MGTANARTVTLSFWVRSSVPGLNSGSFNNSGQTRSYPFTFTISSANTWEFKTITIPGDTSGTWVKNNGIGINLNWSLGTGSTYSGTANTWQTGTYVAATGALTPIGSDVIFDLSGVQLEIGTVVTPFEYRPIQTELIMCQRFFEKTYDLEVSVGTITNAGSVLLRATAPGMYWPLQYKVPKVFPPTWVAYSNTTGNNGVWRDQSAGTDISTTANYGGEENVAVQFTTTATNTISGHWTARAEL